MQNQTSWLRWLPGLITLWEYRTTWLAHDVAGGVVLATVLVPVGIAYATASGVLGIYGLYATIAPLLVYAVFGPSRILVLGPDSSLATVILGVILPLSGEDAGRSIALASMMAVVSGMVCILAGMSRLGFVTELLSKPIRYGYMNGIAVTVLISQLPKLFGFSIESMGPLRDLWAIGGAILAGKANWTVFAIGIGVLAVILLKEHQTRTWRPSSRHWRDDCRRWPGSGKACRCLCPGPIVERAAQIQNSLDPNRRSHTGRDRRVRRCSGVFRRYERTLTCLCLTNRCLC
jgi:MFS superfamily sulfate permease-like transporter